MTFLAAGRSLLAVPCAAEVLGPGPLPRGLTLNAVRLEAVRIPEETP